MIVLYREQPSDDRIVDKDGFVTAFEELQKRYIENNGGVLVIP